MSRFFSLATRPQTSTGRPETVPRTGLPYTNARPLSYPLTPAMLYPSLDPLPSARTRGRRTNAADTDQGGRRAGPAGYDDAKDALPAYEGGGGPPKYMELEMMDNIRTRLHLNLAGMVGRNSEGEGTASIEDERALSEVEQILHRPESGGSSHEPSAMITAPSAGSDSHFHCEDLRE